VAVAETASKADRRSYCVIYTTVGQYFNWYTASRGYLSNSWASSSRSSDLISSYLWYKNF